MNFSTQWPPVLALGLLDRASNEASSFQTVARPNMEGSFLERIRPKPMRPGIWSPGLDPSLGSNDFSSRARASFSLPALIFARVMVRNISAIIRYLRVLKVELRDLQTPS